MDGWTQPFDVKGYRGGCGFVCAPTLLVGVEGESGIFHLIMTHSPVSFWLHATEILLTLGYSVTLTPCYSDSTTQCHSDSELQWYSWLFVTVALWLHTLTPHYSGTLTPPLTYNYVKGETLLNKEPENSDTTPIPSHLLIHVSSSIFYLPCKTKLLNI